MLKTFLRPQPRPKLLNLISTMFVAHGRQEEQTKLKPLKIKGLTRFNKCKLFEWVAGRIGRRAVFIREILHRNGAITSHTDTYGLFF